MSNYTISKTPNKKEKVLKVKEKLSERKKYGEEKEQRGYTVELEEWKWGLLFRVAWGLYSPDRFGYTTLLCQRSQVNTYIHMRHTDHCLVFARKIILPHKRTQRINAKPQRLRASAGCPLPLEHE